MGKSRKSTIRKFEFYETITDNGIESGYVRLANTQFHSDAVMDLSANSYRVFTYMKFRAKGNKVFTYTYENAIKDASISRQTFLKVKKELIDNGLIKQLASNAYSPSKFEFSAEWKNYHSKRRDWFSPKGVLDIVFCAWINESALSVDKKIELARKAIENYPNAWDVIASKLPQGTNSICSTLNTPKYRKISQLLYDEYSKKIIACSKPDELTYKDAAIITHMLRDIIPISNIFVKSLHSDQNIKQIQITDFQVGMDGICKLLYYNKGIKIKEYLLNISKMNYSNYSSVISLELNDISLVDEGYIAYSAAGHGFGNEYPRVYFSSGEKIIIKRKENL